MKNKFKEITIMNAFLCLCVIMIHATSAPLTTLTQGTFWHTFIFCVNKVLCFCVPAFIFLSGFKLHNKYKNTRINLGKFYLGRLKTIVIPYVISVLLYFWYFFAKEWVLLSELPEYIFLGTLSAHFYYIVIAVQFYLLLPLLLWAFKKFPKAFTVLSFICTLVFTEFFTFTYSDRFIGTYIFYFTMGMVFSEYKLYEKGKKLYISAAVIAAVLAVFHLWGLYKMSTGAYFYRYAEIMKLIYVTFAIVALYGLFIFLAGKSPLTVRCSGGIGKASYDIYLYHILAISWLQYDVFPYHNLAPKWQLIITLAVVYGLAFIYSFIRSILSKKRKRD